MNELILKEIKEIKSLLQVIASNQEQAKSNVYRNMKKDLKIKRIEWKFPNVRLIVFNPKNDEEYRVHFEKDLLEWIAFISATIIWILLCSIFLKWLI